MADTPDQVDAELTRRERDQAIAEANQAKLERDLIADDATETERRLENARLASAINADDANAARSWGARNAAARVDAEHQAIDSEVKAQSNAAAFWVAAGVIVILVIGWIIWDVNQPARTAPAMSTVTLTRPAPAPGVVAIPAPAPLPAAPSSTVNVAPAPAAPVESRPQPPVIINNNMPANTSPNNNPTGNANTGSAAGNAPASPSGSNDTGPEDNTPTGAPAAASNAANGSGANGAAPSSSAPSGNGQ